MIDSPQPPAAVRLLLLALLPLVAAAFYWDGQRYDPALLEWRAAPTGRPPATLLPPQLEGLVRVGSPRHFTPANLWEFINGHAEYFLGAGFQGVVVGEYAPPAPGGGAPSPELVVEIYDLGEPLAAFGVLTDEAGQGEPLGVGSLGYRSGETASFVQGPYYVKLSGFAPRAPLVGAAGRLAASLAASGGGGGLEFPFPELGEVTATRYIKSDYRGLAFLDRVVERTFSRPDGGEVVAFLRQGSPESTGAVVERLEAFLAADGIAVTPGEGAGVAFRRVADPYEGEWFFVTGGQGVLGVFAPPTPALLAPLVPFLNPPSTP